MSLENRAATNVQAWYEHGDIMSQDVHPELPDDTKNALLTMGAWATHNTIASACNEQRITWSETAEYNDLLEPADRKRYRAIVSPGGLENAGASVLRWRLSQLQAVNRGRLHVALKAFDLPTAAIEHLDRLHIPSSDDVGVLYLPPPFVVARLSMTSESEN